MKVDPLVDARSGWPRQPDRNLRAHTSKVKITEDWESWSLVNEEMSILRAYAPIFGSINMTSGLKNATVDKRIVTMDVICRWQKNRRPVSLSDPGHSARSSIEPDWSEVLPVTAVVFSPQLSSCKKGRRVENNPAKAISRSVRQRSIAHLRENLYFYNFLATASVLQRYGRLVRWHGIVTSVSSGPA